MLLQPHASHLYSCRRVTPTQAAKASGATTRAS